MQNDLFTQPARPFVHAIREMALPFVAYIADDALSFRESSSLPADDISNAVLIGWHCGEAEPMFVAVKSYLGVHLEIEEAIEFAVDGLEEIGWFGGPGSRHRRPNGLPVEPDYIIKPAGKGVK